MTLVSVVVTTRNSGRTIEACLGSIRAQTYEAIELLVVDNASTDGTAEVASRYADVVEQAGPERSAQRNRGVELARGPLLLWLDSDMVLAPTAVQSAVELWLGDTSGAVAIPERTVGRGFWTRCRALERECYVDDPTLHNPRLLPVAALRRLGGFQEGMAGPEDTDLRHRLREAAMPVSLTGVLIDHDEGCLTLRDVWSKRVYYGSSLPTFAERNPEGMNVQALGTLRAFWRHRRRLAHDPVHAVGMLMMRGMEAIAYGVGYVEGQIAEPRGRA